MASGSAPVFLNVTACASEVVPTMRSANGSEPGETAASAAPRLPLPLRATVCVPSGASSPITRLADFQPALSGSNET